MSSEWKYQIRIDIDPKYAEIARKDPNAAALKPLPEILAKHHATMKCQFDAFADYVAEAEKRGALSDPLYKWTKATIENPAKKEKYLRSFTLYADGQEVYEKEKADALEKDLQPLARGKLILRLYKHDTNPQNNPQVPAHFR
jgi:hypothetical protein